MIRNAGGRTFDVERSLGVLGRIGNPGTICVMHHTDCPAPQTYLTLSLIVLTTL